MELYEKKLAIFIEEKQELIGEKYLVKMQYFKQDFISELMKKI